MLGLWHALKCDCKSISVFCVVLKDVDIIKTHGAITRQEQFSISEMWQSLMNVVVYVEHIIAPASLFP